MTVVNQKHKTFGKLKGFENWVTRLGVTPTSLVQSFEPRVEGEYHAVYLFKTPTRSQSYAVINTCCFDDKQYNPQNDEIILYTYYDNALREFRKRVLKELSHLNY